MFKGRVSSAKWLCLNAKPVFWQILFLTFLGAMMSYISVEFALASRNLLDSATGASDLGFTASVVHMAILLLADLTVQSVYNLFSVRLRTLFKNRLQKRLFSTVMTRSFSDLSEFHSGELINRLTNDIRLISTNIIDIIPSIVMLVSGVIMSFVALLRLDMTLALMCIALGPVVILSSALYGRKVKRLHSDCRESDGRILSFMQECIRNLPVIKAFGREDGAAKRAGMLQRVNYKLNMKVGYVSLVVNILYFVALTAAYYFAVAWCAYKIHIGIMTVGTFTAIIQLVGALQSPFREISSVVSGFFATSACAERIMEIESMDSDTSEVKFSSDEFERIEVSGLKFDYDGEVIFDDASVTIDRGDIAVISGSSGKGKTTLFKLLLGIHKPADGEICIYNNVEKIPLGSATRSLFAYVPQGNMIISGSVGENIAFFDDEPDTERIIHAAKCACIYDYIVSLPKGFDTEIGENGLGLSEGQVQRLAVARAIYSDAPVILLDEATSALDDENEVAILENIASLKNKTCIIITHKSAAFNISTKNIRLENNKLEIF